MFDTETFITEVHNRICIWNLTEKSYSDRQAKRRAWEEIAIILFVDWESYDTKKKNETLVDLQKKWKHLRDYYVREKKKESNVRSGSAAAAKKRKTPYVEMLRFLDVVREMRPTATNIEDFDETSGEENLLHGTRSASSSNSNSKPANRKDQSMTPFQRSLINSMSSKDDSDSDKQFLMSLLAQMKKMTEAQNFDFRLDIMNLVKKYRFGTSNPAQQNTTTLSDPGNDEQSPLSLPQTSHLGNYGQSPSLLTQTSQLELSGYYATDYYIDSPQSTNSQVSTEEDIEALMQS